MDLTSNSVIYFKCDNCQAEDGIKVRVSDLLGNRDSYEVACQNCGHLSIINSKPFYEMFVNSSIKVKSS